MLSLSQLNEGVHEFTQLNEGVHGFTQLYEGVQEFTQLNEGVHEFTQLNEGVHELNARSISKSVCFNLKLNLNHFCLLSYSTLIGRTNLGLISTRSNGKKSNKSVN